MKHTQIASKPTRKGMAAQASRIAKVGRRENAADFDDQDTRRMISKVAYFRAERRGLTAGSELQDWVEAEEEIRRMPSLDAFLDSINQ